MPYFDDCRTRRNTAQQLRITTAASQAVSHDVDLLDMHSVVATWHTVSSGSSTWFGFGIADWSLGRAMWPMAVDVQVVNDELKVIAAFVTAVQRRQSLAQQPGRK